MKRPHTNKKAKEKGWLPFSFASYLGDFTSFAVASSLEAALALCSGEPVVFVIGGTRLFETALPLANGLVITEIHRDYQGDTWFPRYDRSRWREAQREAHTGADGTKFDFVRYERA